MAITYRKTNDPNIFIKADTRESNIRLSDIRRDIDNLIAMISNLPVAKMEPDQETLDFWNEMRVGMAEKADLERQRDEKVALRELLEALLDVEP